MNFLEGISILVVEDDDALRESIVEMFDYAGAKVYNVDNGKDAFEMVKVQSFDIVFSDVRMGKGDGITLMKHLAAYPAPKPLCFLCTGHADISDPEAQEMGVLKVFEKPFKPSHIFEVLQQAIEKRLKKSA